MGGDFSDIFAGFGKRKSVVLDAEANRSMSNSPVSFKCRQIVAQG